MKLALFATAAVLSAVSVSAQDTSYACKKTSDILPLIPTCARTCDAKGLSQDGCPFEDLTCHCSIYNKVKDLVEPCLNQQNCSTADLIAFANVVNPMCDYFNGTANGTYTQPTCPSAAPSASRWDYARPSAPWRAGGWGKSNMEGWDSGCGNSKGYGAGRPGESRAWSNGTGGAAAGPDANARPSSVPFTGGAPPPAIINGALVLASFGLLVYAL